MNDTDNKDQLFTDDESKDEKEKSNLKTVNLKQIGYLRSKGIKTTNVQLSLTFPDSFKGRQDLRHIPNDYARSALFTVRNRRSKREMLKNKPIFHYNEHVKIMVTGEELRAEDDELIWMQVVNYGRDVEAGKPFEFSIKDLVRDIGWSKSGQNYERARQSLMRLKMTGIYISNNKAYGESGFISLIHGFTAINDAESRPTQYRVWIDTSMIMLFAGNNFTSHVWEKYLKLSPVARRLADWVASHKSPYDLHINTFKNLCGSESMKNNSWRGIVRRACLELMENNVVVSAVLDGDFIKVIRSDLKLLQEDS